MHVLHVGKYFPPSLGGMERFLADITHCQRAHGLDVSVLVHDDGRVRRDDQDIPWVVRVPVWFRLVFAPISPLFPWYLRRTINRFRPDVLHLHVPNVSAFWVLGLRSARTIPCVVHWHADVVQSKLNIGLRLLYPFYRPFERALLDHADLVIPTSKNYLESSIALQPWMSKCHVIPLGLDAARLPDLRVEPREESQMWNGEGLRLLAIGRLTYYKGFDILIRAVAGLENCELLIVGEGETRRYLESVIAREGCAGKVRLLGELEDAQCHRLLVSCDVFCLPSRERTEAFGIVLMEAMRYGKPVVATNLPCSGLSWVVQDGVNGLLVPLDDEVAWRQVLSSLWNDPARRRQLGEAGRRRFIAEFGIDVVAKRLQPIYEVLVPGREEAVVANTPPLIVIPARDEEASIEAVVVQVVAMGFDVVVVDDGSVDETAKLARAAGAQVISPTLPQGAWGAIQTGIRYALRHGYTGVITMDADGQHEPAYLSHMLDMATGADVIVGAYPQRGSIPRKIAWAFFRFLTGFGLEDMTSGFRYYGYAACRLLAEEEATLLDYQDVGVLLLLRSAGLRIEEVPVMMKPRQNGASRVFFSWWVVARYMAETTLLCMARWDPRKARPS